MTAIKLNEKKIAILERAQVPKELYELVDTRWYYIGDGGRLVNGQVLTRGDDFVITTDILAQSVSRLGETWFSILADDAKQTESWGSVIFVSELPEGFQRLVPGSSAWRLAKKNAMDRAARYPVGPLRPEAFAEVEAEFGPGDVAPPRARWVYPDSSAGGAR